MSLKYQDKIEDCGKKQIEIINGIDNHNFFVNSYCCLRVCNHPGCQKHRSDKFKKKHQAKMQDIQSSMKRPKAWVFTHSRLELDVDKYRPFIKKELLRLYHLLNLEEHPKYGSVTKYSIHMECKMYPGYFYLHFHVVSGGIRNLRLVRKLWGRVVRYETAIYPNYVVDYMSKYAGKTPNFENDYNRDFYYNLTYKIMMHRFNSIVKENPNTVSNYFLMDQLILEVRAAKLHSPFSGDWINLPRLPNEPPNLNDYPNATFCPNRFRKQINSIIF